MKYCLLFGMARAMSNILSSDGPYVIHIHSNHEAFRPSAVHDPPVTMTAVNGKRFDCYLPHDPSKDPASAFEDLLSYGRSHVKKLQSCFSSRDDSWEYEICPTTVVRKVSLDRKDIVELGKFEGDLTDQGSTFSHFETPMVQEEFLRSSQRQPLYT